jgi:hypothetical protein
MQLQELFECATRDELYERLKSSANYVRWLVYLERKEELENEKLKAIIGEPQ